jgi:hypothetical protein
VLREIKKDLPRFCGRRVAVSVNRRVAERLLGPERETLEALERELGREIEIRARGEMHQEQFEISALEEGAAVDLELPWLSRKAKEEQEPAEVGEAGEAPITVAEETPDEPSESVAEMAPPEDWPGEPSERETEGAPPEDQPGEPSESVAKMTPPEGQPGEPSESVAETAEPGEAPEAPEPERLPAEEPEPALVNPSLEQPVESAIMRGSQEREET